MREQEAAPSLGTPSKSDDVGTVNDDPSNIMSRELNIAPNDLDTAITAAPITVWPPVKYKGATLPGPVDAIVEKMDDGNYKVKLLYSQGKSPMSFVRPYKQGETPIYAQSKQDNDRGKPMEDIEVIWTQPVLWQAWMAALQQGGGMPGGGMGPPMGGM